MGKKVMLPDKYSGLIRLAVKDVELCEADPNYDINMKDWFVMEKYICHVCFAGAVMAQTVQNKKPYPWDNIFISKDREKYLFLNDIREYELFDGLDLFDRIIHNQILEFIGTLNKISYSDDSEIFKQNMLTIANKFEELGY